MDAVGSNIRVDTYGWEVKRILPRINENINEEWISDKTRYACDGILNQRLDTPYLKIDNEFKKISWDLAYKKVVEKIKETSAEKIAGLTGDLTNMETMFIVKEFFQKTIKSQNLDSRSDNYYVNSNDRRNYIFNSSLNGIEESDLIILVGANPRYEATILNTRIRKSYLNNKTDIYSFGDIGDLTYPYKILDNKTDTIKDAFENKNELSEKIKNSKKPIIILGQSALRLKSGKFIFEEFKRFLISVNKINKDWNSLNILSNHASTVGSYDLNILNSKDGKNVILDNIKNNNFDILFLFGQDNLNFKKKNEFIIYVGSHGDKGAEMADVILPGATYTEQDGYYINLEGKIQKAYKASYPPGDAKEDWEIINELSELLKRKKIYKNKDELVDRMMNYLKLDQKIYNKDKIITEFFSEKIVIDHFDYYYSNVIARASKTMSECRNEKLKVKSTGTDG
jgi:NADH-quinone oxidoreductase subunit G